MTNLPLVPTDSIAEDEACSICLESFASSKEIAVKLKCGHQIGRDCILQWLTGNHDTCPFCRANVYQGTESGEDILRARALIPIFSGRIRQHPLQFVRELYRDYPGRIEYVDPERARQSQGYTAPWLSSLELSSIEQDPDQEFLAQHRISPEDTQRSEEHIGDMARRAYPTLLEDMSLEQLNELSGPSYVFRLWSPRQSPQIVVFGLASDTP